MGDATTTGKPAPPAAQRSAGDHPSFLVFQPGVRPPSRSSFPAQTPKGPGSSPRQGGAAPERIGAESPAQDRGHSRHDGVPILLFQPRGAAPLPSLTAPTHRQADVAPPPRRPRTAATLSRSKVVRADETESAAIAPLAGEAAIGSIRRAGASAEDLRGPVRPLPEQEGRVDTAGVIMDGDGAVQVEAGRSKVIHTRRAVSRTVIADARILEVIQFGPCDLAVIGKQPGTTTLTLWSATAAPAVLDRATAQVTVAPKDPPGRPARE